MQPRTLRTVGVRGGRRQRGVVLLIALIVLVAMTLAGIGMMRSIDSGTLVAGNIGFREAAVSTADAGVEAARAWILANKTNLQADNTAAGYYASRQDGLDITGNMTEPGHPGVNWGGSDPTQLVSAFSLGTIDASNANVFYLIHRLCTLPGPTGGAANQTCASSLASASGSTQQSPNYNIYAFANAAQIYYRITVRVNGAKNTVSYVQAIVVMGQ